MIKNDRIINSLMHGDPVEKLVVRDSIGITEARGIVSEMSFKEYIELEEVIITPPSGQTIAPASNTPAATQKKSTSAPSNIKAIWPGQGAPVEVGMTVGLKGANGAPVPGQVSQVDMAANGVKVKNPTTGKDEWVNVDTLEPFMAKNNAISQNITSGTQPTTEDINDLARMRKLAGISEDCSGGVTGAGAIASSPAVMGKVKRRVDPVEESPSLEHPVAGNKTVVGATGPQAQATNKLSANLAARGRKTANRINNGAKR